MRKYFLSLFSPKYPVVLINLLQKNHYHERTYLKQLWQTKDFSLNTKKIHTSRNVKFLLTYLYLGIIIELIAGIYLIIQGINNNITGGIFFGIALIILYPFVWSHLILIPVNLKVSNK